MQQGQIAVVFLILISRTCFAGVVITSTRPAESAEIVDATVQILTSCYANKEHAIGIVGKVPEIFLTKLWSHRHIPVIFIENTTRPMHNKVSLIGTRTKLNVFVIVASTVVQVESHLLQLHNSPWYNDMASYLIPDWLPFEVYKSEGIDERFAVFRRFDIYNVYVVSLQPTYRTVNIFGYNPYSSQAPKPWRLITIVQKDLHSSLHMLMRQYSKDAKMCENLDFNKPIDLKGDVIEISSTFGWEYWKNHSTGAYESNLLEISRNLILTYIDKVNATWQVAPKMYDNLLGNSTKQLHIDPMYIDIKTYAFTTYPILSIGEFIITQWQGTRSQLSKILGVIDEKSQIALCAVLVITVLFFKFFIHQAIIPAILNIVRLTSNTGLTNLPLHVSSRIHITVYLVCLYFFAVTMQGIFTGNLASLLTIDIPLRHPNTLHDLVDLGYTIYATRANEPYFTDAVFKGRVSFIVLPTECGGIVIRDPLNACVANYIMMKDQSIKYDLYISSDSIGQHYAGLFTTIHSPFRNTFNKIIMTMTETDIKTSLYERVKLKRLSEASIEAMTNNDPQVLTLKNLQFAFVILAIGLCLATISFIFEIALNRMNSRITKIRGNG